MPVDVESQLRHLGEWFRAEVTPVRADEIFGGPDPIDTLPGTDRLDELADRSARSRRRLWAPAVAAAVVLLLVGGLLLITRSTENDIGVSGRSGACADVDDPVSFDAQLFPTNESDLAASGFPSAESAADAYLADRTRGAEPLGLNITHEIVGAAGATGAITIVRAILRSGSTEGIVEVATRAVQTTEGGIRWMVQAAASDTTALVVGDVDGGTIWIDVGHLVEGTAYLSTYDPATGEVSNTRSTRTGDSVTRDQLIDLSSGKSSVPLLRQWFVTGDTILFAELQINLGYDDRGEGWQALQQRQFC